MSAFIAIALAVSSGVGCAEAHQEPDAGLDPDWRPMPGEVVLREVRPNPARIGDVVELLGAFPGDEESTEVIVDTIVPIIDYSHERITARVPEVGGYATSVGVGVRGVYSRTLVLRIDRGDGMTIAGDSRNRRLRRGATIHLATREEVVGVRIGGVAAEARRAPLGYVVVVPDAAPVGLAVPVEVVTRRRSFIYERITVESP